MKPTQEEFAAMRLRFYDALDQLDDEALPVHERRVLVFIRRQSLDRGLARAYVPTLRLFHQHAGVHRSDACEALRWLKGRWLLKEEPKHWYGINVIFDAWRLGPKARWGQDLLALELPPDLEDALRFTFVELAAVGVPRSESPSPDAGVCAGIQKPDVAFSRVSDDSSPAAGSSSQSSSLPMGVSPVRTPGVSQSVSPARTSGVSAHAGPARSGAVSPGRTVPANGPHEDHEGHDLHSMNHDRRLKLEREYDVGTLAPMRGHELLEAVKASARGSLWKQSETDWIRRLGENPKLVWQAAAECKQRYELRNPAGWMNRFYLREMGIR